MDKYDEEIAELVADPSKITEHWQDATPLFNFAGNIETCDSDRWRKVNCLTAIRHDQRWVAQTDKLTAAIRADERIPKEYTDITVNDLPVFAEWQRRLDKELNR